MMSPDVHQAFEMAKACRERAYAPYSNFLVGAALKLKNSDEIISGCNIENASFGATICAERVAITQALSRHPSSRLEYLVVVAEPTASPCGLCLQVIAEFADADLPVYLANPNGIEKTVTLRELLPMQFSLRDR